MACIDSRMLSTTVASSCQILRELLAGDHEHTHTNSPVHQLAVSRMRSSFHFSAFHWRAGASQPSRSVLAEFTLWYERRGIFLIIRPYVVQLRMLLDYALLFIRKDFYIFTCCLPDSGIATCVCSSVVSQSWISPGKMSFVVEERGKENVVPVRLLSRERFVRIGVACVIGNVLIFIFTRCLAVISMRNLASERTLVYIRWDLLRS